MMIMQEMLVIIAYSTQILIKKILTRMEQGMYVNGMKNARKNVED
tara:strand:+ start:101 stop:235 length:135 start_codon:yes stop_codon:yes gene_type:complete